VSIVSFLERRVSDYFFFCSITEQYRDAFTVKEQQLINIKDDMIKYFLEVVSQVF
jgi:hypothetical protein